MHQPRIAGDDHDEPVPVVLHPLEQRLDRLGPEVLPFVTRCERVRLVDEEHAVERPPDRAVGLDRGHADVLADEPGAVDLDEMAALEQTHGAIHLGEQPRDRRLARPGLPRKTRCCEVATSGRPWRCRSACTCRKATSARTCSLTVSRPTRESSSAWSSGSVLAGSGRRSWSETHSAGSAGAGGLGQALAEDPQAAGDVVEWIPCHAGSVPPRRGITPQADGRVGPIS